MPSTSVLLGLEDEFVVFRVERLSRDDLRVVIEHRDRKAACPACVVMTGGAKDRPVARVKDLDASCRAMPAERERTTSPPFTHHHVQPFSRTYSASRAP